MKHEDKSRKEERDEEHGQIGNERQQEQQIKEKKITRRKS